MNLRLNLHLSHKVKEAFKFAYTVIAIGTTFVLLGVFLSWTKSPSTITNVVSYAHYDLVQGKSLYLSSPISFKAKFGKAVYHAWVTDLQGHKVYTYPPIRLKSNGPIDLSLYFPPVDLEPGTYIVQGALTYRDNPISTSTVDIEFGRVTIIDDSSASNPNKN